ncbi:MAG: bactofilin family protein [Methyloceanibacter sp.]
MLRRRGTIIAEGLKIVGSVTAEGLVEVNGQIEGDLHCTSLVVSPKATVNGGIQAERVVVNGRVEGPIHGREVVLKSRAYVVGDIAHHSLAIESGAYFDGRSVQTAATNMQQQEPERGDGADPPPGSAARRPRARLHASRVSASVEQDIAPFGAPSLAVGV